MTTPANPTTPAIAQPVVPDPKWPQYQQSKHPVRVVVNGTQHLVPQLSEMIEARQDVPPEYKAVLLSEIAKRGTNAAQVHLHVVDHSNGDTSVQIHIKALKLG